MPQPGVNHKRRCQVSKCVQQDPMPASEEIHGKGGNPRSVMVNDCMRARGDAVVGESAPAPSAARSHSMRSPSHMPSVNGRAPMNRRGRLRPPGRTA
jgi:hypothetical protein